MKACRLRRSRRWKFRPRVELLETRLAPSVNVTTYHNDNVRDGLNNQEIAAAMRSDEATVHELLKNLAHRLGAEDRCELALYGLSTLNELN